MTGNLQPRTPTGMQACLVGIAMLLLAGFCLGQAVGSQSPSGGGPRTHVLTKWTEFHFRHYGTRFNPFEKFLTVNNVKNLGLKWRYGASSVNSSPAVVNGVVYVGAGFFNDSVYALDAHTGAMLWSYATGDYVYSSPAVANGGGLYRLR